MDAIKCHKFSQADHKPIIGDVFNPNVHGIMGPVGMFMFNGDKHLGLDLKERKTIENRAINPSSFFKGYLHLGELQNVAQEFKKRRLTSWIVAGVHGKHAPKDCGSYTKLAC